MVAVAAVTERDIRTVVVVVLAPEAHAVLRGLGIGRPTIRPTRRHSLQEPQPPSSILFRLISRSSLP